MLKHGYSVEKRTYYRQPPSGGCVLKHKWEMDYKGLLAAAAFGRLCVETTLAMVVYVEVYAAAFGRLCVETYQIRCKLVAPSAAAFGRLCVETR